MMIHLTHQTLLDHFRVVDLGNDERDYILTIVITPDHTPISTIYFTRAFLSWPYASCRCIPSTLNLDRSPKRRHGHLTQKTSEICRTMKTREQAFQYPHSERNGTRSVIPSQGHSWRPHRNDWPVNIPRWTCQVSRGHCEDMSTRCYGRKQRHTDEEAEGYGENPIFCGLLVPLPCRMERWNDWPTVTPDTGSVSCVFIRLSRYTLFVTYFVSRSTLQLYLWFLSLLVSQVPSFSQFSYCWSPNYRVSSWELLLMYTWRINLDLERWA